MNKKIFFLFNDIRSNNTDKFLLLLNDEKENVFLQFFINNKTSEAFNLYIFNNENGQYFNTLMNN